MKLLILRPEPGASETAARARALGLDPVVAPLFEVRALAGGPIRGDYDSVLLTSANGARHAPPGLTGLPCFAVGESTAEAARRAGFADVRTGPSDGAAAAAMIAAAGLRRAVHPCGREHLAIEVGGVAIERCVVYAAEPTAAEPCRGPAVALIHSPRAGRRFAELARDKGSILVAAISAAAAEAAGTAGRRRPWRRRRATKPCWSLPPSCATLSGKRRGTVAMDYEPARVTARPKRPLWSLLALPILAFVAGVAAMGWLLARSGTAAAFLGVAPPPPPAAEAPPPAVAVEREPLVEPQPEGPPGERLVIDPETTRRVNRLEERLALLDLQSRAAVGNADRAEGLLVAFAARRAIDRGVALGYIETLLRQRFAATEPQAVATVLTVARQPVTVQSLQKSFQEVAPHLSGGGQGQSWWAGAQDRDGRPRHHPPREHALDPARRAAPPRRPEPRGRPGRGRPARGASAARPRAGGQMDRRRAPLRRRPPGARPAGERRPARAARAGGGRTT